MNALHSLAAKQHDVVASWQLLRLGWSPNQVRERLRGLRRVHRGVCALGDLTELGWYMAAALAMGPTGVVSHLSAAMLMGLRPHESGPIHVSFTAGNRRPRADLIPHRRRALDAGTFRDVPVTSPTQTLRDADLEPHELYRALEAAEPFGICGSGPVAELLARVRGRTRSDAEARFVLLCDAHGFPLPLVNHHLNGIETDFHWPHEKLVVEVDGWEFHKERPQFEEDRRRGLVHNASGYTVTRVSAKQLADQPALVARAIRQTTGW